MAEVELIKTDGEPSGRTIELSDAVFARGVDPEALYQSVVTYEANQSQGTSSTLRRSEVAGGGAKPYRQKGTGRARQGSIRAPHYEGGGVVFGPKPHKAQRKLPKRMRRAAVCSALSDRLANKALVVIEPLEIDVPRTARVVELLSALELDGKGVLFILDEPRTPFYRSARNITGVEVRVAPNVSAYDVLGCDAVVLFAGAPEKLAEVWA